MTHDHAWTHLPDLLDDRDQPELLAHVAGCHPCQRQLFLLGRVDRALRCHAVANRRQRRRLARGRWLRLPAGLAAAAAAALLAFNILPHHGGPRQLTLKAAGGQPIGHATLAREDGDNTSLTLVARGLPARGGDTFVLWAGRPGGGKVAVGRFMVQAGGSCRVRFNLPGRRAWAHFWVTPPGQSNVLVAST